MIIRSEKKRFVWCAGGIWMDSGYEKGVMQFFLLMNGALAKKYRSWIVGGCTWHYTIIHIIHYYTIFIHILPCYLMFFQVPHHLHHLVAHHIHHAGARMSWKRLRRRWEGCPPLSWDILLEWLQWLEMDEDSATFRLLVSSNMVLLENRSFSSILFRFQWPYIHTYIYNTYNIYIILMRKKVSN